VTPFLFSAPSRRLSSPRISPAAVGIKATQWQKSQKPKLRQAKHSLKQLHLCFPYNSVKRSHESSTNTTTQLQAYGMQLCVPRPHKDMSSEDLNEMKIGKTSQLALFLLMFLQTCNPWTLQPPASGLSRGHDFLFWNFALWKHSSKLGHRCCGTGVPAAESALVAFFLWFLLPSEG